MAENVLLKDVPANPCCALLKESYSKLKQKHSKLEQVRDALKQAMKFLEQETVKIQTENVNLKKAYEVARVQADIEREERAKEFDVRVSLGNEISGLKSEILSLQQKGGSGTQDVEGELKLLQVRVSEGEAEINRVKDLLEKERVRAESEKKIAVAEKKKSDEAWKILEAEKCRADKERKLYEKNCKTEDVDVEVKLLQARVSEGEAEINRLKVFEKDKIRADSEKKKAEAEKKRANEAWKIVKAEKSRADEERRLANVERQKAEEYRLQLETLKIKADEARSKLVLETHKSQEASKKLQVERQNMIEEKARTTLGMDKAVEQRKLAETNRKKALDETCCAYLSQQLEPDRLRIEKLQKEMGELLSSRKIVEVPAVLPEKQMNAETAKLKSELQLAMLKREAEESKLALDYLKSDEARKKLEELKQKAIREKRRADSEKKKSEQQRKVAEAYRKEATEEKRHADQLTREVEDYRRRIEEMQKEIQELMSTRPLVGPPVVAPGKKRKDETAKIKLLKKQLKFEKMQVKHAKQVAKLEIGRNTILQQELHRLKQEFIQFSRRLDILDNCFSHSTEGIDDLAKCGDVSNLQILNLKKELFGTEQHQMCLHCKNDIVKHSCTGSTVIDASNIFNQTIECTAPVLPISGGNCSESISGIDSKLEPLLGGSKRKMLQSSAINSSVASFSDRPLVGSQERSAFSVTTATKLAEEDSHQQPTISRSSGKATRVRSNENLAVVAENSVRSPISGAGGRRAGHSKKRKRILDAVELIEQLYSEGQKWHLLIAEKLSMLHTMFNSQMGKHLEEERCFVPNLQDSLNSMQVRTHKKKKASSEEEVAVRHLSTFNEKNDRLGTVGIEEADICTRASTPTGVAQACKNQIGCSLISSQEISGGFDDMVDGNYMRLLDLDNDVDEECYRIAIKMPLSPTLPELEYQSGETLEIDNSKPFVDENSHKGFSNVEDNLVKCCTVDINMEVGSDNLKFIKSKTSHISLLQKNEGFIDSFENLADDENGNDNVAYGNDCICKIKDQDAELGTLDVSISGNEGLKSSCETKLCAPCNDIRKYCVVFSDTHDNSSISRIFCATRKIMAQCSVTSQTNRLLHTTLPALLKAEDLSPKEKACVFFSLLLNDLSGTALGSFGNYLDKDMIPFLDSFAGQLHEAMYEVETRSIFSELCHLDVLTLIEDFLIDRRVLVCTDASFEPMLAGASRDNIVLNGENIILSAQVASTQQLLVGAIILASVCAAIDHIGFICEASYNIFRMRKFDSSLLLTILHVFAYLCGSKYFSLDNYGLIMSVMKSLVTSVEKEKSSADSTTCILSLAEAHSKFPSCKNCPFSEGAVPVDSVFSLLLEKLQNDALSGAMHQDQFELVNSLNSVALPHEEGTEHNSGHGEVFPVHCMDCNMLGCLKKFGMPCVQSNSFFNGTLRCCSDVLSLVELVACNMGWNWTYDNIVGQMLKLLESCLLENFLAAIICLLGQLGRLGIDANGYEDSAVANLRDSLSSFLSQSASREMGLPVQIATVTAILGLLSLNFEELIKSNVELSAFVSQSIPADCIRKWFSSLSNKQRSFSFRLVQSASVMNCKTG